MRETQLVNEAKLEQAKSTNRERKPENIVRAFVLSPSHGNMKGFEQDDVWTWLPVATYTNTPPLPHLWMLSTSRLMIFKSAWGVCPHLQRHNSRDIPWELQMNLFIFLRSHSFHWSPQFSNNLSSFQSLSLSPESPFSLPFPIPFSMVAKSQQFYFQNVSFSSI